MNASPFENELKRRIEQRQPIADDSLRRLAEGDAQLLDQWRQQCLLDEAIVDWKVQTPSPSADLADRVLADWSGEQPQMRSNRSPNSQRRSAWFAVLASVASVILVGWLLSLESDVAPPGHSPLPGSPLARTTDGATNDSSATMQADATECPPQWNELYTDAEEAYLNLFHEAADAISTGKTLVVPGEQFAALEPQRSSTDDTGSTWYRDWPVNFDAVGKQAQRTFDRLFPVEEL